MRVLMRKTMAGPKYNCAAGAMIDVDTETAKRLIDAGAAEAVKSKTAPMENATVDETENAAQQTAKPRGRGK